MKKFETIIKDYASGLRLDVALGRLIPEKSRASIQKAIREGFCQVNDKIITQPATRIRTGQKVELFFSVCENNLEATAGYVDIIWQDSKFAVCNKPAGISVHPCPSIKETTLIQQLLTYFPHLANQGGQRPGIVHRLDKNTSGLLLVALDEITRLKLSEAFARREIHKEYLALVQGNPPELGECREPIGRHPSIKTRMSILDEKMGGRFAHTSWKKLLHLENDISLLSVKIYTGRTHQIRVHLAHSGYPIIGDAVYGNNTSRKLAERQMLHAWKLEMQHPYTHKTMKFTAPPPNDFIQTAISAHERPKKIIVTGNQGCGKSEFCNVLAKKGIPVISADQIVKNLYKPNGEATKWFKFRFNENFLDKNGEVDKISLLSFMENNYNARKEIEQTVHALVKQQIENFFKTNAQNEFGIIVAEIPLFFECNWQNAFGSDVISVGINCRKDIRWQRIEKNRGWSKEKIISIEQWQLPEEKKMSFCNYIVDNNSDIDNLHQQTNNFIEWIKLRSKEAIKIFNNKLDLLFSQ